MANTQAVEWTPPPWTSETLNRLAALPAKLRTRNSMNYLAFLRRLHDALQPRGYLEIGVRSGDSLQLASAPSIGIDPAPKVAKPLHPAVRLEVATSDDYFETHSPSNEIGAPIDLAFIDGMHLLEFALRDFINVERHSHPSGVIVFDDMFPTARGETDRRQHTWRWTGDVFRIQDILRAYRPDLVLIPIDTRPTGLLLVTNLDSQSAVLAESYEEIIRQFVQADPQKVPRSLVKRTGALSAEAFLTSGVLELLRDANVGATDSQTAIAAAQERLRGV